MTVTRTLALLLLTATPANAQVLERLCSTGIHRLETHDPATAAQTLATTLTDIFAGGPPSPDLTIYITLPTAMVPDCPEGAWEPVYTITSLGGDRYSGRIQPTNLSSNGHVFFATIVFTAEAVLEWKPWEGNLTHPLRGGVILDQDQ